MISERVLFLATVFLAYPGAYSVGCSLYLDVSHLALSHRCVCKAITLTLVACSMQNHFNEPFCCVYLGYAMIYCSLDWFFLWLFNNSASDVKVTFAIWSSLLNNGVNTGVTSSQCSTLGQSDKASRKAEGFKPCPNGLILQIGHAAERCFVSTEIPPCLKHTKQSRSNWHLSSPALGKLNRIGSFHTQTCGCRSCERCSNKASKRLGLF